MGGGHHSGSCGRSQELGTRTSPIHILLFFTNYTFIHPCNSYIFLLTTPRKVQAFFCLTVIIFLCCAKTKKQNC